MNGDLWISSEQNKRSSRFAPFDLAPSLAEVVWREGLARDNLSVTALFDAQGQPTIADRHGILLDDGEQSADWRVDSITQLFRGDKPPPRDSDMVEPPVEYNWFFDCVEYHLIEFCQEIGDPTDREMLDLYTAMRRRPDGQSLGLLHDAVWQFTCLALALKPVSAAESEALFRRLARSARTFRMGDSSRNYLPSIRQVYGFEDDAGALENA